MMLVEASGRIIELGYSQFSRHLSEKRRKAPARFMTIRNRTWPEPLLRRFLRIDACSGYGAPGIWSDMVSGTPWYQIPYVPQVSEPTTNLNPLCAEQGLCGKKRDGPFSSTGTCVSHPVTPAKQVPAAADWAVLAVSSIETLAEDPSNRDVVHLGPSIEPHIRHGVRGTGFFLLSFCFALLPGTRYDGVASSRP